jgi:hypothetical protein
VCAVAFNDLAFVECLFDHIENFLEIDDQKTFYQLKDGNELNILQVAAGNTDEENIFSKVLDRFVKIFSRNEIKQFLTAENPHNSNILLISAEMNSRENFKFVMKIAGEFLSQDEMKFLAMQIDGDGTNILHCATQNLEVFPFLLDYLKVNVSEDEIETLLEQKENHSGLNPIATLFYDGNENELEGLKVEFQAMFKDTKVFEDYWMKLLESSEKDSENRPESDDEDEESENDENQSDSDSNEAYSNSDDESEASQSDSCEENEEEEVDED